MTLYLLPNLLAHNADPSLYLPAALGSIVENLKGLIAESEKEGRRFLKRFREDAQAVPIALTREPTSFLLEPLLEGEDWGIVSDAGLPCIADPGVDLVRSAKRQKIAVQAIPGPTSLLMGLMLSGLGGQRFSFHGYLNKESKERKTQLKLLEKESAERKNTQIFIESPHKNGYTADDCLQVLSETTRLCIASQLTAPDQWIKTSSIKEWRKQPPKLDKVPVIFLFQA